MHIVIIGNGITGVTAARFVRKASDHRITVISGESEHHYARTALMYIYMGDMRYQDTKPYADDFWAKNRIDLVHGHAERIDQNARFVQLATGERIAYDRLLLATGSRPNRFGWPGEHAQGVQGLYGLEDLASMEHATRGISKAVVVGGGLIGVEMAEMLSSRGIEVTFLVREARYMDYLLNPEESGLVEDAIRAHGVNLELGAELQQIDVGAAGVAVGVTLADGRHIPAEFVGLAVGVRPNVGLATASGIETGRGVLIDWSFRTSGDGIFAAGDCTEFREPLPGRKAIEQLWYTGRSHGRQVAAGLLGAPVPYEPPLFFNSAKFFDLEYQTYGEVASRPKGDLREVVLTGPNRMVRMVVRSEDDVLVGVNGLGVRLRQNVWSHWLRTRATIGSIMPQLDRGLFDPEFTRRLEATA